MTIAFCKEIAAAGYTPAVYTNKDFLNCFFDAQELKELGYGIWYAYYNKELDRDDAILWQYTSSGTVPEINGKVDMNYMFVDMESGYGWQKMSF